MKRIIFLILAGLFIITTVYAKYIQTCKVKYKRNYDWSDYYTVEVIFMSGFELNNATKTFNYSVYSTYAIIFWDNDEASVIEISTFTGCGTEVTQNCITNNVVNLEGEDQQGRRWEICTKSYCF